LKGKVILNSAAKYTEKGLFYMTTHMGIYLNLSSYERLKIN